MNCDDAGEYLDAYLDGELDAANAAEFERHAAGCLSCAESLARRRTLIARVTAAAPYHRAPTRMRARLADHVEDSSRPTSLPISRAPRWRIWTLAAAAALVVGLTPTLVRMALTAADARSISRELVSAHVRSLMASHLIDVASSDRHTVKPWFSGKVPFAPDVPDLKDEGYELVGGRLDYVGGRPVAAVVYRLRRHTINVFMWGAEAGAADRAPALTTREGFSLVGWAQGGLECWAIADSDPDSLARLARLLREAEQPGKNGP